MFSLFGISSFHSFQLKLPSKFSIISTFPKTTYSSFKSSSNSKQSCFSVNCTHRSSNLNGIHSSPQEKVEIFKSMEDWTHKNVVIKLKPVEQSWQPTDFLPDASSDGFYNQVKELRERAKELPDDYFVSLVGHMVTEEALPTYQTWLNSLDGVRDETGASLTPWAIWSRGWTEEENRHGDLLNKYLYLCGRVDMRQIEKTIQYLIGRGMDFRTEHNPYLAFVYTSFQERATFIAHGNTARLAKQHGDIKLAQICGIIAADEKRHEHTYTAMVGKLFEIHPDGTVFALADLMKKNVGMPAYLMHDGRDDNLYRHFAAVDRKLGVYNGEDYASMLEFLVGKWKVKELVGLSSEGRKAQDHICQLSERIWWKMVERANGRAKKEVPRVSFSWIFDKQVMLQAFQFGNG